MFKFLGSNISSREAELNSFLTDLKIQSTVDNEELEKKAHGFIDYFFPDLFDKSLGKSILIDATNLYLAIAKIEDTAPNSENALIIIPSKVDENLAAGLCDDAEMFLEHPKKLDKEIGELNCIFVERDSATLEITPLLLEFLTQIKQYLNSFVYFEDTEYQVNCLWLRFSSLENMKMFFINDFDQVKWQNISKNN